MDIQRIYIVDIYFSVVIIVEIYTHTRVHVTQYYTTGLN